MLRSLVERSRSSEGPVLVSAAAVAVASLALLRPDDPGRFIAFSILIAISELFEVTLPNGTRTTLGLAPALGLALLGPVVPAGWHPPVAEIIAAFAIGVSAAIAVRRLNGRAAPLAESAGHVLALAAAASLYTAIKGIEGLPLFDVERGTDATDISIVGFVAAFIAVLLVEAGAAAVRVGRHQRVPLVPVFRGVVGSTFALHLSILSVGALLAVSYPALGLWAFPLFLAPLAATQFAFRQFASIKRTYLQTIRALSKVPEMAGYTNPGHSTRVAELAVAIARELSIPEAHVTEIEYAALLHDIGRVSIPDPAQVSDSGSMELALTGATIVRETGHFPHVADMIQHQHDPYRKRGQAPSEHVPIGAKIIKVASAYDDDTRRSGPGHSPGDAIDRLSLGMAFDHDPAVVTALRRVLEKRGEL